jgi:hypothetical protein
MADADEGRVRIELHPQMVAVRGSSAVGSFVGVVAGLTPAEGEGHPPQPVTSARPGTPTGPSPRTSARERLVAILGDQERLSRAISPEAVRAARGTDRALAEAAGVSRGFVHKVVCRERGLRFRGGRLVPVTAG